MDVRRLEAAEKADCERILRSLPEWFGIEEALVDYVADIASMDTWGAFEGDTMRGFITVRRHFERAGEVHVMGVDEAHHRRGIGKALLRAAEDWLAEQGVRWVQVKTLGPSHPDEGYARTRAFYEAHGYEPLEESESRWPGNPCLQMIKPLPPGHA